MILDRALQLELMEKLSLIYPQNVARDKRPDYISIFPDKDSYIANAFYLEEQGLIKSGLALPKDDDGGVCDYYEFRLTAAGYDFLMEDGGISAIRDVVVVKFHNDTVAQLIDIINRSNQSPQDKTRLIDQLKSLPADATKHIVMKLLDHAIVASPSLIPWLQNLLASGR
ncbi:hypothetical protein P8F49_001782 [Salmonella enterica]|nr:hypothetical protein [Salmonella enterica]EKI3972275.1 hypothetical protein [Salmonella enterica]EKK6324544.1 hypothetical protein [Salmonella enterica]EKR4133123.1 hypothetical protein [Salmonella enterica]